MSADDPARRKKIRFHAACFEHYYKALKSCPREEKAKLRERLEYHREILNLLALRRDPERLLQ